MKNTQIASKVNMGKLGLAMIIAMSTQAFAQTNTSGIQPQADQLLRKMSDFLGKQNQFSVTTENTLEAVLTSGQKLQYDSPATLHVIRPNLLKATRKGDLVDQEFYYDGKTLTLFSPGNKYYASTPAPATIDQTINMARDELDVVAPGGDFIYRNSYDMLIKDAESGFYVGKALVGGVKCEHLAFSGKEVDWQIWIQEGDKPLPKKYVITSKLISGSPQFSVFIKSWNLAPNLSSSTFSFKPPKDSTQINFLRMTTEGESAKR
jgi:hypothetical protein